MPINDFKCPECERVERDVSYFTPEYDSDHNRIGRWPSCPIHPEIEMVLFPSRSQTDLLGENFIIDIGSGPQKISSLTELRTIERDSLRKAANGEGAPHIFRGFSNDRSNRDVNTLRGSSYETNRQIPVNRKTASGQEITARARDKFDQSR